MNDFQIFILGLAKIADNFQPVLIYIFVGLAVLFITERGIC